MKRLVIAAQREWARLHTLLGYRRRDVMLQHPPLHLWIEPTNKCNLRCVMCINAVATKANSGFMELALYRSLIDQARAWHPKPLISLFLGGESTLHCDIFDMVSYAEEVGLETFMATNATTLTAERSRRLIEARLSNIIFSFDGYDKSSFESVRVGANFERTIDNIRTFLEIKRDAGRRKPRVTFYSLITRSAQAPSEQAKLAAFQSTLSNLPIDEFKTEVAGHWSGTFDGLNTADFQEAVPYGDHFYPCFHLWRSMSILWDGTVVPCCVDFLGELPLGDARQQPLVEIWNGPRMVAHRRKMINQDIANIPLCTKGTRGCEVPWPTQVRFGVPVQMLPHCVKLFDKVVHRDGTA